MDSMKDFIRNIEHKIRHGEKESSNFRAILIDDDGLASHVNLSNGKVSLVDYVSYKDNQYQFIELTDLSDTPSKCMKVEELLVKGLNKCSSRLNRKEKNLVRKTSWNPVYNEFKTKWSGSIAVVERSLKHLGHKTDPDYSLLIVLKNDTDKRMVDSLKSNLCGALTGMMGKVELITTCELKDHIINKEL